MIQNKKILVTGGAGFIGSNLCEYLLDNNNQVTCLDNFITGKRENIEPFLRNPNFTFIEGDIRKPDDCQKAVRGVEIILHQAALGSVPRSIENPVRSNEINIMGTLNMLDAAKEAGIKRFVYAASSSTYGDSKELPKVEDRIGKPLSPYAVSKYVNELHAQNFGALYGMETIGLRYFNVFGRRQDPNGAYAAVIPKFVKQFIDGEKITINGDGTISRDFTYVDNVIQANMLAASTSNPEAYNQVFNVAYGENNNLNTLYEIIQDLLGRFKPEVKKAKPFYGPNRKGDIEHSLASIEKAKKLLGYNPLFDLQKGLENAIRWYWENLG
jgi:UDP-N-acetylglucosamine 4-epimerase